MVSQVALPRSNPRNQLDYAEGIAGVYANQLTRLRPTMSAAVVRSAIDRPATHRPLRSSLPATDALDFDSSRCGRRSTLGRLHVIDLGAATVGSLGLALDHFQPDGALYVGNPAGEPHWIGLKFWGHGGRSYSAPGSLEKLRHLASETLTRPTRRAGKLQRRDIRAIYKNVLAERYHALRPLRLICDTTCRPLRTLLAELTSQVACELLPCRSLPLPAKPDRHQPAISHQVTVPPATNQRRLWAIAHEIVEQRAHFGIWIDGDGDACQIVDERGRSVHATQLLAALAHWLAQPTVSTVLVEEDVPNAISLAHLLPSDHQIVRSAPTREAMFETMLSSQARLGGGPSGRIWFGGQHPTSDALRVLTELLGLLSQADVPLSSLVDSVCSTAA